MGPVEGFGHERHGAGAAAAEQNGRDRHPLGVFPLRGNHRALARRNGEAGVGMGGGLAGARRPGPALPVGQVGGRDLGQALPPDVTVVGQGDVGEDAVGVQGGHRIAVGLVAGAGRHAEEARFGVDGVEAAVVSEPHPADVVADGLGLPARQGWLEHGHVGLAAGTREGGGNVADLVLRRGQLQDQHVLGQPAFVPGHDRGDAKGEALLPQEGVAAIARAVGPDLPGLGIVDDVLLGVAGPGDIRLTSRKGRTEGVNCGHEEAIVAQLVQRRPAHAGHHPHRDGDIGAVRDLDAQLADLGTQGPHAEGADIHRATGHAAVEQARHLGPHRHRVRPVVRRPGVDLALGANEGPAFDPRNVAGIGGCVEGVRTLGGIQARQCAPALEFPGQGLPLRIRSITPVDTLGPRQGRDLLDPGNQPGVVGGSGMKAGDRGHQFNVSEPWRRLGESVEAVGLAPW